MTERAGPHYNNRFEMLYREKGGGLSPLARSQSLLKFDFFFFFSLCAFQIGSRLVRQGKKFGRHSSDFRLNEPARRVIDRTLLSTFHAMPCHNPLLSPSSFPLCLAQLLTGSRSKFKFSLSPYKLFFLYVHVEQASKQQQQQGKKGSRGG